MRTPIQQQQQQQLVLSSSLSLQRLLLQIRQQQTEQFFFTNDIVVGTRRYITTNTKKSIYSTIQQQQQQHHRRVVLLLESNNKNKNNPNNNYYYYYQSLNVLRQQQQQQQPKFRNQVINSFSTCRRYYYYHTTTTTGTTTKQIIQPNRDCVNTINAPDNYDISSAVVYTNIIQYHDHIEQLVHDIQTIMKRRRYERGHWDSVIVKYKETELIDDSMLSESSISILRTIQNNILEPNHIINRSNLESIPSSSPTNNIQQQQRPTQKWLPCHIIDLHKDGQLNAHVDSIRFSGQIVAGLSLCSPSIMRLRPVDNNNNNNDNDNHGENNNNNENTTGSDNNSNSSSSSNRYNTMVGMKPTDSNNKNKNNNSYVDLYLPINSLYVLSGMSRYNYTHELLPSGSIFIPPPPPPSLFSSSSSAFHSDTMTPTSTNDHEQQPQAQPREPIIVQRNQRYSIIFRDALIE